MTGCRITEQRLQRWLDGESSGAAEIEAHVEHCAVCAARLDTWRAAGDHLRALVDAGVGDVEPLRAVQNIHARIANARRRTVTYRLKAWWQDTWAFNRRAVAGLAVAAAMGIASAPAVVYWLGVNSMPTRGPVMASVVVESLEFDGHSRAVVYRPSGATAIIWVEPERSHGVEF